MGGQGCVVDPWDDGSCSFGGATHRLDCGGRGNQHRRLAGAITRSDALPPYGKVHSTGSIAAWTLSRIVRASSVSTK